MTRDSVLIGLLIAAIGRAVERTIERIDGRSRRGS